MTDSLAWWRRALTAGLCLALPLTACSDDDDEATSAPPQSTAPGTEAPVGDTTTPTTASEPPASTTTTAAAPDETDGRARPSDAVAVPTLEGPVSGGERGIHSNPMPPGLAGSSVIVVVGALCPDS